MPKRARPKENGSYGKGLEAPPRCSNVKCTSYHVVHIFPHASCSQMNKQEKRKIHSGTHYAASQQQTNDVTKCGLYHTAQSLKEEEMKFHSLTCTNLPFQSCCCCYILYVDVLLPESLCMWTPNSSFWKSFPFCFHYSFSLSYHHIFCLVFTPGGLNTTGWGQSLVFKSLVMTLTRSTLKLKFDHSCWKTETPVCRGRFV